MSYHVGWEVEAAGAREGRSMSSLRERWQGGHTGAVFSNLA